MAEVAQKIRKSCAKVVCNFAHSWMVLWYFGKFWQRTTKQRPSILYKPNKVQKLDIVGNKVFVHDNDMLYCKLRYNVISPTTLAQWHRE